MPYYIIIYINKGTAANAAVPHFIISYKSIYSAVT